MDMQYQDILANMSTIIGRRPNLRREVGINTSSSGISLVVTVTRADDPNYRYVALRGPALEIIQRMDTSQALLLPDKKASLETRLQPVEDKDFSVPTLSALIPDIYSVTLELLYSFRGIHESSANAVQNYLKNYLLACMVTPAGAVVWNTRISTAHLPKELPKFKEHSDYAGFLTAVLRHMQTVALPPKT